MLFGTGGCMRNKFPGRCSCGTPVAEGCGTLDLVDGHWAVRCDGCGGSPAKKSGSRPKRPSATKPKGARRAKRPSATKRRATRHAAKPAGSKPRRGKRLRAAREWAKPSPTADLTLIETEIGHTDTLELPDGRHLPCSAAYARTEAARLVAAAAGHRATEFDLVVALAELSFFGHTGDPSSLPGPA